MFLWKESGTEGEELPLLLLVKKNSTDSLTLNIKHPLWENLEQRKTDFISFFLLRESNFGSSSVTFILTTFILNSPSLIETVSVFKSVIIKMTSLFLRLCWITFMRRFLSESWGCRGNFSSQRLRQKMKTEYECSDWFQNKTKHLDSGNRLRLNFFSSNNFSQTRSRKFGTFSWVQTFPDMRIISRSRPFMSQMSQHASGVGQLGEEQLLTATAKKNGNEGDETRERFIQLNLGTFNKNWTLNLNLD